MKGHISRLAGGMAVYGIGGVLSRFISFFLLPVFTKYLAPADYGISAMLVMLSYCLTQVFSLGLGTSIGIAYNEMTDAKSRGHTVWTAFVILLASAVPLAVLGTAFASGISVLLFGHGGHAYFVVLTVHSACAGIILIPFTMRVQLEEKAKQFVVLSLTSTVVSAAVCVYMVVFLKAGIRGFIEAGLVSQVLTLVLFMGAALKVEFRFVREKAREMIRLGAPMIPSFASLFVIQQANRYILQYFRGIEEVGLYAVGYNIGMTMSLLVNAFTSVWPPYFLSFTGKTEDAGRIFGRVTTYYTIGLGTASLMFFVFAKPVVLLMAQPAFLDSYKVIGLAATSTFLTGMFGLFLPGVYFAKEVKFISVVQAAAAVGSIMVNVALIPYLGIVGAAVGLVSGTLLMVVLMHAWNTKRRGSYLAVEYDWGRISAYTAVYAGFALLMTIERSFPVAWELFLSLAASAALVYVVYRLLDDTEKRALGRYIGEMRLKAGP